MTLLQQFAPAHTHVINRFRTVIALDGGARTTVHVVRYDRQSVRPRLVAFADETRLLDWCEVSGAGEALTGGFFLRDSREALGDFWVEGIRHASAPVAKPWGSVRGSLCIEKDGDLALGRRCNFPAEPAHSLLQAGPLLVRDGTPQITNEDTEGFSAASHQFDSDISDGRYPRAAIGTNNKYIWSVVCDGRTPNEAGLTLGELAGVMSRLGADDALNLDGGSSSTQISGGRLRNRPIGDDGLFVRGRPLYTAIVFK